jgi:hypothetical protein
MRPAAIGIVGFLVLAAIFAGIAYVQFAIIASAVLVCITLGVGLLRGEHRRRLYRISAGSRENSSEAKAGAPTSVQIEGHRFSVTALPPTLDFALARRNFSVILGTAVAAIGSGAVALFSLQTQRIDPESPRFFLFYSLFLLVTFLMIPSYLWLRECSIMKTPGITLAAVYGRGRNILGTKMISYGFTDSSGGHHGGSAFDFGSSPEADDYKIVFCDPLNPTRNQASCALVFHRVEWAESRG